MIDFIKTRYGDYVYNDFAMSIILTHGSSVLSGIFNIQDLEQIITKMKQMRIQAQVKNDK